MPCGRDFVCFWCRLAARKYDHAIGPEPMPCPKCSREMDYLGSKIPVPGKKDLKGWERLKAFLVERNHACAAQRYEDGVRYRHRLEQEVLKLERLPASKLLRRQSQISGLRAKIEALKANPSVNRSSL